MNIAETIMANLDTDLTTKIETDVSEVSNYMQTANRYGFAQGVVKGFTIGAVAGASLVITGLALGLTMDVISEHRAKQKDKE